MVIKGVVGGRKVWAKSEKEKRSSNKKEQFFVIKAIRFQERTNINFRHKKKNFPLA
jgi:hypothetical protein